MDDSEQFQSSLDVIQAMFANQESVAGLDMETDSPEDDDACDTSNAHQSLLDMILKNQAEQSTSTNPFDGLNLTLEAILGDSAISDTIDEVAGENNIDEEEKIRRDALKLFDQSMAYQTKMRKPTSNPSSNGIRLMVRPKDKQLQISDTGELKVRRYTKYERAGPVFPSDFTKDIVMSFPRTKYDVDSTSFFEKGGSSFEQTKRLQKKLEEERSKVFNEQIKKDVERLLLSANKIYGARHWTEIEKKDFEKYCKILRTKGTLSHAEKEELKQFYAKAYNLKEVRNVFGEKDYVFAEELRLKKSAAKLKNEDNAMKSPVIPKKEVPTTQSSKAKLVNSLIERLQNGVSSHQDVKQDFGNFATSSSSSSSSSTNNAHIGFSPSAKLSADKEFRIESIEAFENVLNDESKMSKRRGRPPKKSTDDDDDDSFSKMEEAEEAQKDDHISQLLEKANEVHGFEKKWSNEEKKTFAKFYEIFKDKQNFTLVQSKELQSFYKKAFGKLEAYEVERERDERLIEKKKYWQEYRRQYYLNRKAGIPIEKKRKEKPIEDEAEKRKRKAAYLREWRTRKAQEKQDLLNMLLSAAALPTTSANF